MVAPAVRREMVGYVQQHHHLSQRRACRLVNLSRTTARYRTRRVDAPHVRQRICELAEQRPRFGYRRLTVLLRRAGLLVNHKRVYRLYREEALMVRRKRRKRLTSACWVQPAPPVHARQHWAMDFTSDVLATGRRLGTLNVVDRCTRECVAIEVDTSLPGQRVVRTLERLRGVHGLPKVLVVDNRARIRETSTGRLGVSAGGAAAFHRTEQTDAEWPCGELQRQISG